MTDRIEDTDTTTGKPSGPAGPVAAAEAPRQFGLAAATVSYTHLTLPTTPYV